VEPEAIKRFPEEGECLHLVPHHEIREHALIDAGIADRQHQVHAHTIGPQSEEDPVAQAQDTCIPPDKIESQRQDGIGQEFAEEIQ
jgi:hypothetical protein